MVVPLVSQNSVLGVLLIADSTGPTPFTADEISLAEEMASSIVRLMENINSLEKLRIRTKAQKALIETAANLQQEIESSEMYRIVSDKISELIPCNELAFYVFDWPRRVVNPAYATGPYSGEVMEDRGFPVDIGIVGHVARTKRAEIVVDTEDDPRGDYIPGTPATHSRMLAVPLIGRKEVLGVIELVKYPPENFTNEDLEVATLFANHAAVALENGRLLREVSDTKDQLELHMDLLMHDIANYTTPVWAYVDTLKDREDLGTDIVNAVSKTHEQMDNIMLLVDMVRTMARLRENEPVRLVRADLGEVLKHAVDEAGKRSQGKKVEISIGPVDEPVSVMADDLLPLIFVNLFTTAIRSSHRSEVRLSVEVGSRKEGRRDMWWIRVSQPDRSIPDHLKSEVLRMTKSSRSELTGGLGIGLATAKGIVDRYSGYMWVSDIDKRDPGKGCVYNITLPKMQ